MSAAGQIPLTVDIDRTAPVLPLIPGTPDRRTHDYKRNGTTNLYAALHVAWKDDLKTFVWHKSADEILDSFANYCQRISDSGL